AERDCERDLDSLRLRHGLSGFAAAGFGQRQNLHPVLFTKPFIHGLAWVVVTFAVFRPIEILDVHRLDVARVVAASFGTSQTLAPSFNHQSNFTRLAPIWRVTVLVVSLGEASEHAHFSAFPLK